MKPFSHLVAFAIIVTSSAAVRAHAPSPSAPEPAHTVGEVHAMLAKAPKELMDKNILLRGMVLEQVQVRTMNPDATRCSNHLILVDPDPELQKRFHALKWDALAPFLHTIPHVLTTEATPGGEGGGVAASCPPSMGCTAGSS